MSDAATCILSWDGADERAPFSELGFVAGV